MATKTVMQELIEKLERFKKELKEKYDEDPLVIRGVSICIAEANKLLEKEKQIVIDAWDNAAIDATYGNKYKNGETYYTQTYTP